MVAIDLKSVNFRTLAMFWLFVTCLLFSLHTLASSNAAGTVVFISGTVSLERGDAVRPLERGSFVLAGDQLSTGVDGYIQVRMKDRGFLSLRPESQLIIKDYHLDTDTPANNRVQIELKQGVLRSVTGAAGHANKDAFRLNTPVAAIGIRGTDFTTFTDNSTSKVSVSAGGIAMATFNDRCTRDQLGSCTGATELMASDSDGSSFLVIDKQSNAIKLSREGLTPNDIQPPHPSEQLLLEEAEIRASFWRDREFQGQSAPGASSYEDGLERVERYLASPGLALEAFARGDLNGDDILPNDRELIESPNISWGRWSHLSDEPNPTRVSPIAFMLGNGYRYAAVNSTFALLEKSPSERIPGTGRAYFTLNSYEAYLKRDSQLETAALSNAALIVDFEESRFATRMDLHADSLPGKAHIVGAGDINEGYLSSDGESPALIDGVLTSGNNEAGLLFDYQISPGVNAVGSTHWVKD